MSRLCRLPDSFIAVTVRQRPLYRGACEQGNGPRTDVGADLMTRSSEGLVASFQLALSGHCVDSSLMYDLNLKAVAKDGPTCFEGERVTSTQGEPYATLAPVSLRSCSSCSPAFPADRFSDSIVFSAEHEFNRCERHQAEPRQGEVHKQRYL